MKACQIALGISVFVFLSGCQERPSPSQQDPSSEAGTKKVAPVVRAPAFTILHQHGTIVTVIVPQTTPDEGIVNLIWLLRDATHSGRLNSLGISETLVENRDPLVSFQIYRGTKCADEHYRKVGHPCGSEDHDAGWYQIGSFVSRDSDAGVVYHGPDETKAEELWEVGSSYEPKANVLPSVTMMPAPTKEQIAKWGTDAQRQLATDYTSQVWAGGLHATFTTTEKPRELLISADWLVDDDEQRAIQYGMKFHAKEACSAGFRIVRLSSLPSHPDSLISLHCPSNP